MHQKKKGKKKVNASEDFLEVVVNGNILVAVMSYLGMSSLHDKPLSSIVSHDIGWRMMIPGTVLKAITQHVVSEHVDLATVFLPRDSKEKAQPLVVVKMQA